MSHDPPDAVHLTRVQTAEPFWQLEGEFKPSLKTDGLGSRQKDTCLTEILYPASLPLGRRLAAVEDRQHLAVPRRSDPQHATDLLFESLPGKWFRQEYIRLTPQTLTSLRLVREAGMNNVLASGWSAAIFLASSIPPISGMRTSVRRRWSGAVCPIARLTASTPSLASRSL